MRCGKTRTRRTTSRSRCAARPRPPAKWLRGAGRPPYPHRVLALTTSPARAAQGLPKLRQEVARYMSQTVGIPRTADDVLIGPGSKELLFLLQLVNHGELLLPNPSWVSYAPQVRHHHRHRHQPRRARAPLTPRRYPRAHPGRAGSHRIRARAGQDHRPQHPLAGNVDAEWVDAAAGGAAAALGGQRGGGGHFAHPRPQLALQPHGPGPHARRSQGANGKKEGGGCPVHAAAP